MDILIRKFGARALSVTCRGSSDVTLVQVKSRAACTSMCGYGPTLDGWNKNIPCDEPDCPDERLRYQLHTWNIGICKHGTRCCTCQPTGFGGPISKIHIIRAPGRCGSWAVSTRFRSIYCSMWGGTRESLRSTISPVS